jgi:hypothetical protein
METITVSRTTDREFTLTRARELDRVTETNWCPSWFAVYHRLRKWHVDDDGIQSIEHQLTKKAIAVVQTGLSAR